MSDCSLTIKMYELKAACEAVITRCGGSLPCDFTSMCCNDTDLVSAVRSWIEENYSVGSCSIPPVPECLTAQYVDDLITLLSCVSCDCETAWALYTNCIGLLEKTQFGAAWIDLGGGFTGGQATISKYADAYKLAYTTEVLWLADGQVLPAGQYTITVPSGITRFTWYDNYIRKNVVAYGLAGPEVQGGASLVRFSVRMQRPHDVTDSSLAMLSAPPLPWNATGIYPTPTASKATLRAWSQTITLTECASVGIQMSHYTGPLDKIAALKAGWDLANDPLVFRIDPCVPCEMPAIEDFAVSSEYDGCNPITATWTFPDSSCCIKDFSVYGIRVGGEDYTGDPCSDLTAEAIAQTGTLLKLVHKNPIGDSSYSVSMRLRTGAWCLAVVGNLPAQYNCEPETPEDDKTRKVYSGTDSIILQCCESNEWSVQTVFPSGTWLQALGTPCCTLQGGWRIGRVTAENVSAIEILRQEGSSYVREVYQEFIPDGIVTLTGRTIALPFSWCSTFTRYWKYRIWNECGELVLEQEVTATARCIAYTPPPPPCTPGCIYTWTTLNGSPTVSLIPYQDKGGTCTRWRLYETGYNLQYLNGTISQPAGILVGLPNTWTPPAYGYNGYMCLEIY